MLLMERGLQQSPMRHGHRPDVGVQFPGRSRLSHCRDTQDIRTVAANAPTAKRPLARRDPNHITASLEVAAPPIPSQACTQPEVCALAAAIAVAVASTGVIAGQRIREYKISLHAPASCESVMLAAFRRCSA